MKLTRYWIEFEIEPNNYDIPIGTQKGCGVTGYNSDDALNLIKDRIFRSQTIPKIKKMTESIDVSTLDSGHVILNMAPPNIRGVWFPLGYQ